MPALLDLEPDAHLAVIGQGSFEHALRRLVARLQVGHAVTFTSFDATQREALGALVQSSDVVALMSDFEAHPVAVMEAVALGRKVVVADTSGMSELAVQGLAVAVPVNTSPRALAEVLADVARRPDPVVSSLPTWEECVDEILDLYREILSGASSEKDRR
jgi:glycosyltransferase involved in cell wall biosynthesis